MIKASDIALVCGDGVDYNIYNCYKHIEDIYNRFTNDRLGFRGSNHMFRELDWVGTKQDCIDLFGCIPVGAFAFMTRSQDSIYACLPSRYHGDGLPDAYMSGIVVHPEEISPKWTYIGLTNKLSYGELIDAYIRTHRNGENSMSNIDIAIQKLKEGVAKTYKVVTTKNGEVISETEHSEPYITITHEDGVAILDALKQDEDRAEKIKEGLRIHIEDNDCDYCPYNHDPECSQKLARDALEYIKELEDECRHVAP